MSLLICSVKSGTILMNTPGYDFRLVHAEAIFDEDHLAMSADKASFDSRDGCRTVTYQLNWGTNTLI